MSKNSEQPPSAPIEEEYHVGAPAPQTATPYPQNQASTPYPQTQTSPPYPTMSSSSPPTYGSTTAAVTTTPDYQQPPPSYQDALSYPSVPPANQMPKPYTPQTEIPHHGAYPQANSSVYAGAPLGFPHPQGQHNYSNPQPAVVRTVITTTVPPTGTGNCIWCRQGTVNNETDLCCLICLILLAVCTFPFGLFLLCCIPCTVRPRCNRCRRLQD